jgi:hypothetical protein
MIEFEEPEKGYIFEGLNITSSRPKVRVTVLFLLFIVIIGFFIKNDFNFDFLKISKAVANFECSTVDRFDSFDDKEMNFERAKKVLEKNKALLESEVEFKDARIDSKDFEGNLKINGNRPVINLYFSGETELQIPDMMCDFQVNVFYK